MGPGFGWFEGEVWSWAGSVLDDGMGWHRVGLTTWCGILGQARMVPRRDREVVAAGLCELA